MKKLLISFFFTISLIAAKSQLTKGNWLIGGSGNFYSYNEDYAIPSTSTTGNYTMIDLSVTIGYFPIEKFSVGLRPYLSTFKGASSGGGSSNNLKLALGPFMRYYFLRKEKQFNILTDISYQVGINKSYVGASPKGKFNNLSLMGGTEIFFNSSIGIEILLGYKNQIVSYDNTPEAYTSNRTGVQASIGFQFHLEKD